MASKNSKMRARNAALTNAPIPFVLNGASGPRDLVFKQLTPSGQYELLQWAKQQTRAKTANATEKPKVSSLPVDELSKLSAEDKKLFLTAFAQKRAEMSHVPEPEITQEQIFEALYSVEGVARQLWILSRKMQPDLNLDYFKGEVNAENYEQIAADIEAALPGDEDTEGDDPK